MLHKEEKYERAIKTFNKVINIQIPEGYNKTIEMRESTHRAYLGRGILFRFMRVCLTFVKAQCYASTERLDEALVDYQYIIDNHSDDQEAVANTYQIIFGFRYLFLMR